ncbi:hypothetical protein Desde_1464 [Desulfitobacterium dehalogenans ATCC 51507]|uniref:Uncharacterized protein n=1 Tax=Desulfitobacterium dehalogenans (strain ATCC 51507 / DSM 9161 / JW/IU-DC1) TaxID=756499 RepID=I4A7E9_DESDJ|nr:hypothetical protein [Desulfitobacterium dehalogenans]AFL99883.1 hypothetical protein Desde_1464 [Desulfitobacterium dehalogenans ATCC 51507]
MLQALEYKDILSDIEENDLSNDIIGILLARPKSDAGRTIVDSLPYYHHRSGKNVNFYLPGYGAYWHNAYPDEEHIVSIEGTRWSFSNTMYAKFIEDFEKESTWKYSGESELILLDCHNQKLDYSKILVFHLDAMLQDKTISSVNSFFEKLFRFFAQNSTIVQFSNRMGSETLGQVTLSTILEKLPLNLGALFVKAKHYAIIDKTKS